MSTEFTKKKKKSSQLSKKRRDCFSSPPVIYAYLLIINYASFFGPSIFESIIDTGVNQILKIEPQFEDILNKYNHLLTQDYSQPCQFQREMIKLHKDSYFSKYNQFKAFFNNQFSFQQAYQFISKRKKNDTPKSFQKRYQQFFIYTNSGIKIYLLADNLSTNIWIIFRGTDELQNKSSNLSSQLQQINTYSLTALGLLFNKSNLGISLGDCENHYNSQIFRLLSEAIHTIFNGILYLSEHFLEGKRPAYIYVTGVSLGGQLASIFSLMYPRMYSTIKAKYQKLITSKSYCFPLSSPKIFQKDSCQQMESYIENNQIAWMRYFTLGDQGMNMLLKSKGWYYPQLPNLETSFSYCPQTHLGKWVVNPKESVSSPGIMSLLKSVLTYHQNLFGCYINSLIHPGFLLTPFIVNQLYQYLSKDTRKQLSGQYPQDEVNYPFFDFLIDKYRDRHQKHMITKSVISNFWKCFFQKEPSIFESNKVYNYLHGFSENRNIDSEIYRVFNPKLYSNLNIDVNSLYQFVDLNDPEIKKSPLFRDYFYYLVLKGIENRQQFQIFITYQQKSRQIEFRYEPTMLYNTDFLLGDPLFFTKFLNLKADKWTMKISPQKIEVYQYQHKYIPKIDISNLITRKGKTLIDGNC